MGIALRPCHRLSKATFARHPRCTRPRVDPGPQRRSRSVDKPSGKRSERYGISGSGSSKKINDAYATFAGPQLAYTSRNQRAAWRLHSNDQNVTQKHQLVPRITLTTYWVI